MKIENHLLRFGPIHLSSLLLLLLLALFQLPVKAQSLLVLEKSGQEYAFSFDRLHKVYFTNDQLIVDRTNGVLNAYELGSLRSLRFTESTINTSAAELVLDESLLKMYPNPANHFLHVEWINASDYSVEIVSFSGKSCLKVSVEGGSQLVDIKGLANGLYLCRVSNGQQQVSKKFIKN